MINVVHSLRGYALPLSVPIHNASKAFDKDGNVIHEKVAARLTQLGKMAVETAAHFRPVGEPAAI